eukprot:scaffold86840_cov33-Tisochrysis_lutea.AAC.1
MQCAHCIRNVRTNRCCSWRHTPPLAKNQEAVANPQLLHLRVGTGGKVLSDGRVLSDGIPRRQQLGAFVQGRDCRRLVVKVVIKSDKESRVCECEPAAKERTVLAARNGLLNVQHEFRQSGGVEGREARLLVRRCRAGAHFLILLLQIAQMLCEGVDVGCCKLVVAHHPQLAREVALDRARLREHVLASKSPSTEEEYGPAPQVHIKLSAFLRRGVFWRGRLEAQHHLGDIERPSRLSEGVGSKHQEHSGGLHHSLGVEVFNQDARPLAGRPAL